MINEGTPLLPCRPPTPQQQRPDDSDQAELQNSASICFQFPFLAYFHELTLAAAVTGASSLALPCLASDLQRDSHLPLGAEGRMPRSHTWRQVRALARGAGRGWARSERCSAQGPPAHLGRRRALSDTEEEQSATPRWGAPTSPGLMNIGLRGRGLCGTGAWIESREAQGHSCMATTPQKGGTPGAQGRGAWETQSLACVRISQIRS